MTEKLLDLLQRLYGAKPSALAYEKLQRRLEIARTRLQVETPAPLYSQRDVVLITYGDTLQDSRQAPLHTLHQFAAQHLRGIISAIHILPFYPFSSDDGFSVIDYYTVDPKLGTWDHIAQLGTDFDLMFDAVINHMSAQSEWFKRYLAGDAEFANAFIAVPPNTDLSKVTRPRTLPLLTPFQKADSSTVHVWTTFSADQVDLNYADPELLLRVLDVVLSYIEHGARIIRLDAIAYIWKEIGTNCIHRNQVHWIIQLMRHVLDEVAPNAIIITETNVPHPENVSYFGDGYHEAQMVYNFTLPPLVFHTLLAGSTHKIRDWINSLETPSDRTTFFNFTASHDGIGLRPVEGILTPAELQALIERVEAHGGRVSYRSNPDGTQSPYELNITYVDALTHPSEPLDIQVKRFLMSQAIAMTLAGVPAVYIHSLLGSRNYTDGVLKTEHNRTINREKLVIDEIERALDDATSFRSRVFNGLQHLLATRIVQPAFHPNARQLALDLNNDGVLAIVRQTDSQQVIALYNVTAQPQTIDLHQYLAGQAQDLLNGEIVASGYHTLLPYQMRWLES